MADFKIRYSFEDNSAEILKKVEAVAQKWLWETGEEIASHAKDNCKLKDDAGAQLRKSYAVAVDENKHAVFVGSPLEAAFWEEFGTGEFADTSKNGGKEGRKDWWLYYPNNPEPRSNTLHYATKEDAQQMAEYIKAAYGEKPKATNGTRPRYTLEKAYKAKKVKAIKRLKEYLRNVTGG